MIIVIYTQCSETFYKFFHTELETINFVENLKNEYLVEIECIGKFFPCFKEYLNKPEKEK